MGKPLVRKIASRKKAAQAADGTTATTPANAAETDTAKPEIKKTDE